MTPAYQQPIVVPYDPVDFSHVDDLYVEANHEPEWADLLPSFSPSMRGRTLLRRLCMRCDVADWLGTLPDDFALVRGAVMLANDHLERAERLAQFPRFRVAMPPVGDVNVCPLQSSYVLWHAQVLTERGNMRKFPIVLEARARSGVWFCEMSASMFPDGSIGRVETSLSYLTGGVGSVGWCVTSAKRGKALVPTRISTNEPGRTPTLWSWDGR